MWDRDEVGEVRITRGNTPGAGPSSGPKAGGSRSAAFRDFRIENAGSPLPSPPQSGGGA